MFPLHTFSKVLIKLVKVFFFLAVVPTTGIPSSLDNLSKSIFIFFFFASSSKLTHNITLLVISIT